MTKKIIALVFIFSVFLTSSFSQAKNQTKIHSVDDENYMWYEFKAKQFGKVFKFYAFKTDTQRDNRTMQLFKRSGWGMAPNETITEFYNFEAAEKTVLWKEELMPIMKKGGYKYAFTTYRTNDKTIIYLYTFYYDQDHDDLYMLRSYK